MPRPLQKRRYPKPAPVTIRTEDNAIVLPAGAFPKRRSWHEVYNTVSVTPIGDWAMEFDQRLYVMDVGDAFMVSHRSFADLWWFVRVVNGPEMTISAETVIFDVVREHTFPFRLIEPIELESHNDAIDANVVRGRLGMKPRDWIGTGVTEMVVTSLPSWYTSLLKPLPTPCHGYANACVCADCERREMRSADEERWAA